MAERTLRDQVPELSDAEWEEAVAEAKTSWGTRFPGKFTPDQLQDLAEHDVLMQVSGGTGGDFIIRGKAYQEKRAQRDAA